MKTVIITGTSNEGGKAFFNLLTTRNSCAIICFYRCFLTYQLEIAKFNSNVEVVLKYIKVNFIAPILSKNLLNDQHKLRKYKLTILDKSTGAVSRPIDGWGMYCSTKVAIRMVFDVIMKQYNNTNIRSINPVVLDTRIQETSRSWMCQQFLSRDYFTKLKEIGELRRPEHVAKGFLKDLGL